MHDNYPSTGIATVSALFTNDTGFYFMGYSGGADGFLSSSQYTNYEAVLQSELFSIGTLTKKATLSKMEVRIAEVGTNGNVRVSYRADKVSSFTVLATITSGDFASVTAVTSDVGLTDLEDIQIQVETHGDIELKDVIFYP